MGECFSNVGEDGERNMKSDWELMIPETPGQETLRGIGVQPSSGRGPLWSPDCDGADG